MRSTSHAVSLDEQFYSEDRERPGEYALAVAVLELASDDLKHRDSVAPRGRRAYAQAFKWLTSDDRSWPYSFLNICDLLDLTPAAVRSKLLRNLQN